MALERPDVIDAIGVERETENLVLTIADAWDWEDEPEHLRALEAKLAAYLEFIDSGQILESYPDAKGRKPVIDIVGRFPISASGMDLLSRMRMLRCDLGIEIRTRCYPGS